MVRLSQTFLTCLRCSSRINTSTTAVQRHSQWPINSVPNSFAYADDTVIYSIAQTETFSLLSETSLFKKVQMWYTYNFFTINVSRTHACIFFNRKLSDSPHINLDKTKVKTESYITISGVNLDSRSSSCHCYKSTRIPIPKSEVWHECSVCPKMLHYLYSLKANVLLISFINISATFTAQKCTSYPQSSKSFLSLWG